MNVELLALIGGALTAMLIAVALREVQREYAVLLSLCCAAALMIWAVGTIDVYKRQAVSIHRHRRFAVAQRENSLRLIAGKQCLAAAGPVGLQIDPLNRMLRDHRMRRGSHLDHQVVTGAFHHRKVLLTAG